jgi:hypothetical protein
MRKDMFKVVIERPRMIKGDSAYKADGRRYRNCEDTPHRISMKRGYRQHKWLNENLAPMKRFLLAQAGRPWDKVFSELSQGIDLRNTVQAHIFAHIEDFVALHPILVGDDVMVFEWNKLVPLAKSRAMLFVHPRTGLLLINRVAAIHQRKAKEARQQAAAQALRWTKTLPDGRLAQVIDGQWFTLTLVPLPLCTCQRKGSDPVCCDARAFDVVHKKWFCRQRSFALDRAYGKEGFYAQAKQQISAKQKRQWQLETPI